MAAVSDTGDTGGTGAMERTATASDMEEGQTQVKRQRRVFMGRTAIATRAQKIRDQIVEMSERQ